MDIGEVFSAGAELLGWWFETFKSSEETLETDDAAEPDSSEPDSSEPDGFEPGGPDEQGGTEAE
ncbi:hypothetical protein [Brevibacterium sp. W7.2]|uniref:hypothetical protein n=1 Tax=Brevibacterium sp. W7.2 TaxID=2823518 RepID=UPI001BA4902F|nr:hypothetical protein [Brevibacterium sp. W7.2]